MSDHVLGLVSPFSQSNNWDKGQGDEACPDKTGTRWDKVELSTKMRDKVKTGTAMIHCDPVTTLSRSFTASDEHTESEARSAVRFVQTANSHRPKTGSQEKWSASGTSGGTCLGRIKTPSDFNNTTTGSIFAPLGLRKARTSLSTPLTSTTNYDRLEATA